MPIPPQFGFFASGGSSVTTWSTLDKNANVTLSAANLRMTTSAGTNNGVRATASRSSGKQYFEVVINVITATSNDIGIMTGATPLADGVYIGSDATGYGWASDGFIYHNGVRGVSLGTYTTADVISVAVDLNANLVWWAKNNTFLNGNPGAGTGGTAITGGAYFPASSASSPGSQTGRFAPGAMSFAPPAGFAAWG